MNENKVKTNKNKIGLVILIIFVIAIISIFIIGKFSKKNIKELAGNYKIVELYDNGENISDQLTILESNGMDMTLELYEDGTGKINMLGVENNLTYTSDYIDVENDSTNEENENQSSNRQKFTIDEDGRIILEDSDSSKMIFEKIK